MSAPAAARAQRLLERPGAWLDQAAGGYAVRLSPDRRRRPALVIGEPAFAELTREPGLRVRALGGWTLRNGASSADGPAPGRPGFLAGERTVTDPDGRQARRSVNLGESPIAWLARRRDPSGRPWLTAVEAAAGERLRADAEAASLGPALTMRWDGLPRAGSGQGPGFAPGDRARQARARVDAALEAAGPGLSDMLRRICIHGSAMEAAERGLGLPRRSGKAVLKLGLQRLAAHYRLG